MFIFLFLFPIVYALDTELDECGRFILNSESPCLVISSYVPTDGCLNNVTVYFQNTTVSFNASWVDYTPFCAFQFNETAAATYIYNSSVEDGIITVRREDNMLSLILVQIGLVIFFIILGLPFKFGFAKFLSWSLAAVQVFITMWIIYLNETGVEFTYLLFINYFFILIVGGILSVVAIIMLMTKMSTGEGKKLNDDGYTKFVFDGK